MITLAFLSKLRIFDNVSYPSIRDIERSSVTISGLNFAYLANASAPLVAVSTSKFSAISVSFIIWSMVIESSTARTFIYSNHPPPVVILNLGFLQRCWFQLHHFVDSTPSLPCLIALQKSQYFFHEHPALS